MSVERAFPNLTFQRLTNLVQPDDGTGRFFATEQPGRIRVFPNDAEVRESQLFLDITRRVSDAGNEEGLLGLAFDPVFKSNRYFYLYYSASGPRRSVLSRFQVSPSNENSGDPDTEVIILEVEQPAANHNGGQLAFGPDGFLYVSLGDGGFGGDPQGNGQNPETLLGSILRIDVAELSSDTGYRIPPDNPFVDWRAARPEIWAYGLRNPWRFSFDQETGVLWAADVGQRSWEEVDIIEKGANYGWNTLEGNHCFSPRTSCDATGTTFPIVEYDRSTGQSITAISVSLARSPERPDSEPR